MDGIVIWSDPTRDKAIVWCSDHSDLAYIVSRRDMLGAAQIPKRGTLVSFHSEIIAQQRRCRGVVSIAHKCAPDLAHALKEMQASTPVELVNEV